MPSNTPSNKPHPDTSKNKAECKFCSCCMSGQNSVRKRLHNDELYCVETDLIIGKQVFVYMPGEEG